ncbi:MAG: Stp1/IreP family PP2C-type Ser/Thr phosphatase [Actinobacteria bacterium]|nr:Stp1/IreP family PP2C-type Ser/Thr phosphatase [Actinomycetota bacterium]
MKLKWGASTDVGMVRQQNEDSYLAEENLYVVADGMGGHNAGEVASALAVTTLKAGARTGIDSVERFRELVQQANTAIYTASLDDSTQSGMGTTLTALSIVAGEEPRVLVANVGDARTYMWRNNALTRLSVDHSYVQELVNEGIITPEEARVHPRRNIVTRALGIDRSVVVDVFSHLVRTGDRIVLCSDGLVDEVSDADIAVVLGQHSDPQDTAEALVMVANTAGGRDNTTVIVVDVLDDISEPVVLPTPDNTTPMEALAPMQLAPAKKSKVGMVLFWSALVAIVFSAVTVIGVYGRSGYFIGFDSNDQVAIYRGRVGGILWFQPTIETQTSMSGEELPEDILRDVALNREFSSSSQASKYLALIRIAIIDATTTTSTTTTVR